MEAQRWSEETVMSVAKRRWGQALSARTDLTQHSQALLRGVVYNVNRLVLLGFSAWAFRQSKAISQLWNCNIMALNFASLA